MKAIKARPEYLAPGEQPASESDDRFPTPVEPTIASVTADLRVFIAPGQVTELRALAVSTSYRRTPHTLGGFFDSSHLPEMAQAALEITATAKGVYFCPNPLRPDLLSRCCNRIDLATPGMLTSDADVLSRRWLLIDLDPVRKGDVGSTDEEKTAAWDASLKVRAFMTSEDWPLPVVGDSGNGYHLLFSVVLPQDDGGFVAQTLRTLAARFDTPQVKIDTRVFNPARIVKLPGTWSRKGDDIPARPHRRAHLLEVPW
jgi:hypothetical protein